MEELRGIQNIEIKTSVLRKGQASAIKLKKSLAEWLEEAILEKIEREQKN